MEIIIRNSYTPQQVKAAALKAIEFRTSRYTSGCANLDNMIELGKAVILCPSHSRRFSPKQARYMAHPDKKLRRVVGQCDVCKEHGLSSLFLNERDGELELRKLQKFQRALEYGKFVT
jgi:hypothetical protein